MSRGLGRIERAIVALIEDPGNQYDQRWAASDLAVAIYRPEDRPPTRAERVAVLRAMHSLAQKYPHKVALTGGKGREDLWLYRPSDPPEELIVPTMIKVIHDELGKIAGIEAAVARAFKTIKQRLPAAEWEPFLRVHFGFTRELADDVISRAEAASKPKAQQSKRRRKPSR